MFRATMVVLLLLLRWIVPVGGAVNNDVSSKTNSNSVQYPFEVNRVDAKTFLDIDVGPSNLLDIQCDEEMQEQGVCSIKDKDTDACAGVSCGHGRECVVNDDGRAVCDCAKMCAPPGMFIKVCSDHNETFNNICHLYREKCMCQKRRWACQNDEHANIQLQYLGKCKKLNNSMCNDDVMQKLGVQAINWVKAAVQNYAHVIASRPNTWIQDMEEELDEPTKALYPILYKLCVDKKDVVDDDEVVVSEANLTRAELIGVTAKFVSRQPCILTLLDNCDLDSDDVISVSELEVCLGEGIDREEIFQYCWL